MIKNQENVKKFLGLIDTIKELSMIIKNDNEEGLSGNIGYYQSVILEALEALLVHSKDFEKEEPLTKANKFIRSACDSFVRLLNNQEVMGRKIEFEFLPILQECYNYLYYFGLIYPDEIKIDNYFKDEYRLHHGNKYVDEAEKNGKYKYDVSICVLAYNKLEYTKQCVESLLKHLPKNHTYELIFINHGSTDGTKEYFESITPDKQFDILVNGGGLDAEYKICEGKYYLRISNDVIITENAIDNMVRLMEEDEKVAYIVPSTPNIVNLQTIEADYSDLEELNDFCKRNNRYDPSRHEWRTRLMSPLFMFRSSVVLGSKGLLPDAFLGTADNISFNDDRFSLVVRRAGFKAILMKDAYCHHFGSVTVKNEIQTQDEERFYFDGRMKFYRGFGIDPWGIGSCYDPILFKELKFEKNDSNYILGINCGQGSNALKVKEELKFAGNKNINLFNITDVKNYLPDLNGISDKAWYTNVLTFNDEIKAFRYKFIIWEDFGIKDISLVTEVYEILDDNGVMAIKFQTNEQHLVLKTILSNCSIVNCWMLVKKDKSTSEKSTR